MATIIAIQSQLTNNYLSVCNECNGIPGNSVDAHVTSVSQATPWALWQIVNVGVDQVALINQATGTYLSVCSQCNNIPGFSVDVHGTGQASWATWSVTQGLGSGFGLLNSLTNSLLTKTSSGVGVNVSSTGYSTATSWNIIAIDTPAVPVIPPAPTPTPLIPIIPGPSPLYPPLTPLVPPSPSPSPSPLFPPIVPITPISPLGPSNTPKSHPKWALWTGVTLIALGAISFILGLTTDKKFFTFSGLGMLALGIIFALIFIFA